MGNGDSLRMDDELKKYDVKCIFDIAENGYIITLSKRCPSGELEHVKTILPPDSEQIMINLEPLSDYGRVHLMRRLARHYDTEVNKNGKTEETTVL